MQLLGRSFSFKLGQRLAHRAIQYLYLFSSIARYAAGRVCQYTYSLYPPAHSAIIFLPAVS
jgi:hypothetical protein